MHHKHILVGLYAAAILPASANSDFTNPLTAYTGNSQANFPAQPAFLADSGLNVSFVWGGGAGAWEKIDFFPASTVPAGNVAPGARFGTNTGGNGTTDGRNYLRTLSTNADYHLQDFDAYVTVRRLNAAASVFFGMGTAALGTAKAPDRGTNNASAFLELESALPNAARRVTGNSIDTLVGTNPMLSSTGPDVPQTTSNALRMRMRYNAGTATVTYTLDYDYNGTFEEQQVLPSFSVATQVSEWGSGDRASIFFGGDRSVIFTDLVIEVASTTPPPPPVSGLQVTGFGNESVTLTWNPGFTGNTYSVYRSTTSGNYGPTPVPIATTNATTFTYTDVTGLTNGTPYFYVVTQTNAVPEESAFSNEVTATPTAGALAPTGLIALNAGDNAVSLDWDTPIADFDWFNVYRSADGGANFTLLPSGTGITESKFFDLSATSGISYTYKIRAVLFDVESPDSTTAVATPLSLEVFADFNAATVNSGRGVLGAGSGNTWNGVAGGSSVATSKLNDSSGAVTSLGIEGGSNFGAFPLAAGTHVGGNPATLVDGYNLMSDYRFSDGGNIRSYTFSGLPPNRRYDLYLFGYGGDVGQNSGFRTGGIAKQTTNPETLTTLTETRHYVTFTVVSDSSGSFSFDWSGPSNLGLTDVHTGNGTGFNGFQLVENASAVIQPLNLITEVGPETGFKIKLTWTGNANPSASYKVYRSTTPATEYTLLATSPSASYLDASAVPGTTYYYVVTSVIASEESFFSAEASGMAVQTIIDTDNDTLSDADEALIGTNPNDPSDFFVATAATVTPTGGSFNVSFTINGAQVRYVIERSTTLLDGSWTDVPGTQTDWTWPAGSVLNNLTLTVPAPLAPAPGGKEFFRAKGVVVTP